MNKYKIQDRETATLIDESDTLEEAENKLQIFEDTDRAEGTYTKDFYEIVEVDQ